MEEQLNQYNSIGEKKGKWVEDILDDYGNIVKAKIYYFTEFDSISLVGCKLITNEDGKITDFFYKDLNLIKIRFKNEVISTYEDCLGNWYDKNFFDIPCPYVTNEIILNNIIDYLDKIGITP